MTDSVLFHYVHFLNCLPPADAGGARRVFEDVEMITGRYGRLRGVQQSISNGAELISAFKKIENSIEESNIPLIHIDAHASQAQGIEFYSADNEHPEYIGWDTVANALGRINLKTNNRPFLVLCACSAFKINAEIKPYSVAPFSVCLSPHGKITLQQIESSFIIFYRKLTCEMNLTAAYPAIKKKFEMTSSEYFLKEVLIEMGMKNIGKDGKKTREGLLTDLIKKHPNIDKKQARKHIKNTLTLTETGLQKLSSTYLCGRPFPFTASEITTEARKRSIAS